MMVRLLQITVSVFMLLLVSAQTVFAGQGETMFKSSCSACHSVGKGRLVGPDLKDVDKRHSEEWLHAWIKSSQTVVKSGDTSAVRLFAEYNNMIMPDQNLSDADIKEVLAYIKETGDKPVVAEVKYEPSDHEITNPSTHAAVQAKESSMIQSLGFGTYLGLYLGILAVIIIGVYMLWVITKAEMQLPADSGNGHSPKH